MNVVAHPRPPRWLTLLLGIVGMLLLGLLVFRQFAWLGADLSTAISHGIDEDWDWQLTLYEACRKTLLEYREFPGWSPYTQGGVPLLANPESPFLYPPFLLVLGFGTHAGIKLWILFHLQVLIVACWCMGRELGLGPISAHGAGILGVLSVFIPEFIAYGHIMYLPLCWLPLAWVAWRRGRWGLCALCLALGVLGGGHYLFVYGVLWLALDALLSLARPERLAFLAIFLTLNLLLLGQGWATWPLLAIGLGVLLIQRPRVDARPLRLLLIFGLVLGLTALLVAPKLTTLPPLWARAERLVPQGIYGIADDYDLLRALSVLLGLEERPSGHEGQNVFHSSVPIVLAVLGMPLAFRRRPVFTVTGLFFLVLGWSGATPVNLAQVLHRLPPFDLLRVIERYALVWTLFVGFFAAFGAEALWRMPLREGLVSSRLLHLLRWISRSLMVLALMHYGIVVSPKIASVYQLGLGHPHAIPEAGAFRQVENELTNWEATRANLGKPGCRTTAWLADPGPVRVDSDPDYHGEVYLLLGDPDRPTEILPVEARIAPNRIDFHAPAAGRLVVNQNAFAGWSRDGNPAVSHGGLLAAEVGPGPGRLAYRPPGLVLGFTLLGLGLVLLAASPLLRPLPPCPRSGAKVVPGRC